MNISSTQVPVVIIGAGPAGIACALWLHKLGVGCVLLEAGDRAGGLQALSPYDNLWVPGVMGKTGQDIARAFQAHVEAEGIDLRLRTPALRIEAAPDESGFVVETRDQAWQAASVVLASGTRPRAGGFTPSATVAIGPGTAIEAMDVGGKTVAVLGGGDNAFDQARFLLARGARPSLFTRARPRAQKLLQAQVPDVPVRVGPYTADQATMTVNGHAFDILAIMYGFEAVMPPGVRPDREAGYIAVDRWGETSVPGLYACGEVTNYWHPCVTTSCAHGIQVAKAIADRTHLAHDSET